MLKKLFCLTLLGSAMAMMLAACPAPIPTTVYANIPPEPTNAQVVLSAVTGTIASLSHRNWRR